MVYPKINILSPHVMRTCMPSVPPCNTRGKTVNNFDGGKNVIRIQSDMTAWMTEFTFWIKYDFKTQISKNNLLCISSQYLNHILNISSYFQYLLFFNKQHSPLFLKRKNIYPSKLFQNGLPVWLSLCPSQSETPLERKTWWCTLNQNIKLRFAKHLATNYNNKQSVSHSLKKMWVAFARHHGNRPSVDLGCWDTPQFSIWCDISDMAQVWWTFLLFYHLPDKILKT